jgi:7,8-dihydroneopterin aldolase/epimerase/oxygenase
MDTIFIRDLELEMLIGVYDWERRLPQPLPFQSGNLDDALDYAQVVERIKRFAAVNPHPLLERFAEALAQMVISEFGAPSVTLRVAKLAPIPGVRELGVAITRTRAEGRPTRPGP